SWPHTPAMSRSVHDHNQRALALHERLIHINYIAVGITEHSGYSSDDPRSIKTEYRDYEPLCGNWWLDRISLKARQRSLWGREDGLQLNENIAHNCFNEFSICTLTQSVVDCT